jgi:DNA-binding response OmpR family regulator
VEIPEALTVLVYSNDPQTRDEVRGAIGHRPAPDLPPVEFLDVDDGAGVLRELDAGGVDLAILDGEAWPTGGMGLCRQLKDEITDCPPVFILVGRRDDAWLAAWSRSDGTLSHPLDPINVAATVAELLRGRMAGLPVRRA